MQKRIVAVLAVLMCAVSLVLLGCGGQGEQAPQDAKPKVEPKALEKKALDDYTWEELTRISKEIAKADGEDAAREVAKKYGIVEEDGSLTTQTKQIVLNDTRALDVRVAGVLQDERADGKGKAGLTFMTVGAWDVRPMNDEATVEGGWEQSSLRAWLANDAKAMLDKDLAKALRSVNKYTNNAGPTDEFGSATPTADELWLFSAHEVCGDVQWDSEEFKQKRGYQDIDGLINSEGSQYEAFRQAEVTSQGDPQGYLSLEDSTGAMPWWYRTVYPFDWTQYGDTGTNGYFYQVNAAGFPESLGSPEVPAGVVVGFCV